MMEFYNNMAGGGILEKLIIKTDITKEDEFISVFSDLLLKHIKSLNSTYDENNNVIIMKKEMDLPYLMKNFLEMGCKFKGYKSDVIQQIITISNGAIPSADPSSLLSDAGDFQMFSDDGHLLLQIPHK